MTNHRHVVIDAETTGIELEHQVTNMAWYDLSTDTYGEFVPPHDLTNADPIALQVSRYHEVIAPMPVDDGTAMRAFHRLLGSDGTPTSVVCANPAFDVRMVMGMFDRAVLPQQPFKYRPFDIEEAAYWLFGDIYPYGEKPGLAKIAALLGIPNLNHHRSLNDVIVTAAAWRILHQVRATIHAPVPAFTVPTGLVGLTSAGAA